jgi:hypothetical protein
MDSALIISCSVSLAVALGLGLWRQRALRQRALEQKSPARGALEIGIVLLVALAVGVLTHRLIPSGSSGAAYDADSTMAALKRSPLIRLVIADVPGAEQRLRAALQDDERNPVQQGATRALAVIGELRASHIVPALKAADDASALAAIAARTAFIRHLQARDLATCRTFALAGMQRPDLLDGRGQELFDTMLKALEDAYRNGRDAKLIARRTPDGKELEAILIEAGFQPVDIEKLGRLADLPEAEACALAARFNAAPSRIASGRAGALARHLLSSQ